MHRHVECIPSNNLMKMGGDFTRVQEWIETLNNQLRASESHHGMNALRG
jgi:hypothetical protein